MKTEKKTSYFEALRLANSLAVKSGLGVYLSYLAVRLFSVAGVYVSLTFTEFVTDSIVLLARGELEFRRGVRTLFMFCCLLLLFELIAAGGNILWDKLSLQVRHYYEKELYAHVSGIKADYYETHHGNLIIFEASEKSLDAYLNFIKSGVELAVLVPTGILYAYYLLQVNWGVLAVYLVMLAFYLKCSGSIYQRMGRCWEEIQPYSQRESYFMGLGSERSSHQECRLNRLFPFVFRKWESAYDEEYKIRIRIFRRYEVTMQAVRFVFNIPYIMMLALTAYEILIGKHTLGFLTLMNELLNYVINTLDEVQQYVAENQSQKSFLFSHREVMELAREETEALPGGTFDLTVRGLKYRYLQAESYALKGMDLRIRGGEKIALVGINGSGKTTFSSILAGLLTEYEGQVAYGEGPGVLKNSVSCIQQNFARYQMTIRENIQVGAADRELGETEIYDILDRVGLKEAVSAMPDGLETSLGQLEEGRELSSGQWQRLAVARLLANKSAGFWILDEPTAYLDPLAEIEIYRLIQEVAGDRTVIFISHRLGFARWADRVLLFENGRVLEEGSHEELMNQGGRYAGMFLSQVQAYE